tara:strand:- start:5767 stop:6876 length:1110 start_codon:yes stop_codon:yes gene_type:complete
MTYLPPMNNEMPRDGTLVANIAGKKNTNFVPGTPDASKGRFGDTFIRPVDGQLSHVNKIEANVIDNLGMIGQMMVKDAGAGTTNPDTGAPEYYFPWGALLSAGMSAYQMNKGGGISDSALADKFNNYKTRLDTLDTRADDMMDPNSSYNQNLMNDANKRNFDQLGFTNMMTDRGDAQGGVNAYSGIQNQQNTANLDKTQAMNMDMSNKIRESNLAQGTTLKGQVLGGYQQYDQMFAQKEANEAAQKQLMIGQAVGGLGQGLTYGSMKNDLANAGDPGGDLGKTFEWMSDDQFDMRNQGLADNPWIEQQQAPGYDFWEDESNFGGGSQIEQLLAQYPNLRSTPGINTLLGQLGMQQGAGTTGTSPWYWED